jgi:hypothetical protein
MLSVRTVRNVCFLGILFMAQVAAAQKSKSIIGPVTPQSTCGTCSCDKGQCCSDGLFGCSCYTCKP